jgi:predicted AAA+ superfamily ATPase
MGVSSYRRVLVYAEQERRHIMRDPWFMASTDRVLTEEYSDSDDNEEKLLASALILDALHNNASAYLLFIQTFLKPKDTRP